MKICKNKVIFTLITCLVWQTFAFAKEDKRHKS